jgi:hypothetical protein
LKKTKYKLLPGHPSVLVGDDGSVWLSTTERFSVCGLNSGGYKRFRVDTVGWLVHRAVLVAHDREPEEGEVCRHLNGDRLDNRLENLAWGTISENRMDSTLHGTGSKLSEDDVRKIRNLLMRSALSHRQIAWLFGVCGGAVHNISTGRTWSWVE